jgi:integrase
LPTADWPVKRSNYHRLLPAYRCRVFPSLSPPSEPVRTGTHPPVSSPSIRPTKASTEHCDAAPRRFAILLHQDSEEGRSIAETPYPKKVQRLPIILSSEEVTQLIDSALTPFHRILLMTLYATGVRRAELARLKVTDIDSRRMIIHIQGGKGRKDRDVMLSPKLLEALREYWRGLGRKPTTWLFPGRRSHTGGSGGVCGRLNRVSAAPVPEPL